MRVSSIDDAGNVVAPNRHADGVPEDGGGKPFSLPGLHRSGLGLVKPDELGIERWSRNTGRVGLRSGNPVEALGVQTVDQLRFAPQEPGQFNVAVWLNVDANGIEVRQLSSGRVAFPVIRISGQPDVLTRTVFCDPKWSRGCRKLPRDRFRLICGDNRQSIE